MVSFALSPHARDVLVIILLRYIYKYRLHCRGQTVCKSDNALQPVPGPLFRIILNYSVLQDELAFFVLLGALHGFNLGNTIHVNT